MTRSALLASVFPTTCHLTTCHLATCLFVTGLLWTGLTPNCTLADEATKTPKVDVLSVRRIFHNGEHNAFTDLVRFKDKYYLTFRSCPDGHMVYPSARIIIMTSDDTQSWREVHRFSVANRDTRDPHFVVFQDKLFVYTGTWHSGAALKSQGERDLNLHLGYAAWSEDGRDWHSPILLEGTFGHYVWRAAVQGKQVFLCGRRKREFSVGPRGEGDEVQSMMLVSDDGLVFRQAAVFQESAGDETAFLFENDGSLLAVGRRGRANAQLIRSTPPYQQMQRQELDRYIGGPLLTKWEGRYVVGGRHNTEAGPKTSLCWLVDGKLIEFAELPSAGDNSYPGFLDMGDGRAVVSYYSTHEKGDDGKPITAIYQAELKLTR